MSFTNTPQGVSFYAHAEARFDDLSGGAWQRVFDFANGPAQDNVLFGQLAGGTGVRFELWIDGVPYTLDVFDVLVEGETAVWTTQVTDNGVMEIFKDGTLVGQRQAIPVPDIPRGSLLVEESNFPGDTPLIGEVSAIRADIDGDGTPEIVQGIQGPQLEPQPEQTEPFTVEAEAIIASGFSTRTLNVPETNGTVATLSSGNRTGELSYTHTGGTGRYTLDVLTFDENDGVSPITIFVNGSEVARFSLDQQLGSNLMTSGNFVRLSTAPFDLTAGDVVSLRATANSSEFVRIDRLEFTPEDTAPPPPPEPEPSPSRFLNPTWRPWPETMASA